MVPEWLTDPTPPGRLRIEINPGLAFGTGGHESTRLCLAALERYVQPGTSVLDVGTGGRILAIASHLLGAGRVFACDVDPLAIEVAAGRCASSRQRISICLWGPRMPFAQDPGPDRREYHRPGARVARRRTAQGQRPSGTILVSGFETHEAARGPCGIRTHGKREARRELVVPAGLYSNTRSTGMTSIFSGLRSSLRLATILSSATIFSGFGEL